MREWGKITAALLLFAVSAPAADSGAITCRIWMAMDQSWKIGVATGAVIGAMNVLLENKSAAEIRSMKSLQSIYLPHSDTPPREISQQMDLLCRDPANSGLWVSDLLEVVAMRFDGARASKIEDRLADMRSMRITIDKALSEKPPK